MRQPYVLLRKDHCILFAVIDFFPPNARFKDYKLKITKVPNPYILYINVRVPELVGFSVFYGSLLGNSRNFFGFLTFIQSTPSTII